MFWPQWSSGQWRRRIISFVFGYVWVPWTLLTFFCYQSVLIVSEQSFQGLYRNTQQPTTVSKITIIIIIIKKKKNDWPIIFFFQILMLPQTNLFLRMVATLTDEGEVTVFIFLCPYQLASNVGSLFNQILSFLYST